MSLLTIILQDAPAAKGDGMMSIMLMVGIVIVFYFFMIRPQMQRQKKEKQFRASLGKNDKIVTIGGMYGKIVSVDEKTVLLEVDEGTKLRFDKASIREQQPNAKAAEESK